ncbi:hypothetical protein JTE90_001699 [Oedothorax gibbosus]|uniref:Uncharacterized protein n=1 Tax=Oedothorax gibbosus TaxID=931172 RepID=A0AAV6TM38_9ARAC|nr:hypothetical protein JTE90_001699 [Oedothorax gibbosus]
MEVKRKRKRYNRFLRSDESIPRSSSYRRIHTKDTATNMPYCTADVEDCSTSSDDSFVNEDDVNLVIDEEWSSDENDDHDEDYPENPNINFKDGYKSLFPGSDVSVIEAYMSILSFSQRFSLSKSCFNDLLQLLEFLLPPSDLPGTAFTFFNKMTSVYDGTCEMHMYCHQCKSFVCKLSDCVKPDECPVCGQSFCATDCKIKGTIFSTCPLNNN